MVAKVHGPVNRMPENDSSDSESDYYENGDVGNVSESYDDNEHDQQELRHRRKRSSLSFTDSDILSST